MKYSRLELVTAMTFVTDALTDLARLPADDVPVNSEELMTQGVLTLRELVECLADANRNTNLLDELAGHANLNILLNTEEDGSVMLGMGFGMIGGDGEMEEHEFGYNLMDDVKMYLEDDSGVQGVITVNFSDVELDDMLFTTVPQSEMPSGIYAALREACAAKAVSPGMKKDISTILEILVGLKKHVPAFSQVFLPHDTNPAVLKDMVDGLREAGVNVLSIELIDGGEMIVNHTRESTN